MIRPDIAYEEHEEETDAIIPQMYGGRTNAEELKRIAGVIEKYQIQEVYMTHHQRLKLAGIKPELIERVKKNSACRIARRNSSGSPRLKRAHADHRRFKHWQQTWKSSRIPPHSGQGLHWGVGLFGRLRVRFSS